MFEVRSQIYKRIHYLVIGSILQRATNYSIVWGAGFIAKDSICCQNPKKIYAVRGPLTRKILLEQDIYCPEIYGDPALLMPLIYNPKDIHKKYNLGIIPHYIDKNNEWLKSFNLSSKVKIIDIQNNDSKAFIDSVLECKKIASSSLHGIIIADSYYIPSLWIEFSDKVYGDGFKFYDYFLSVKKDIKSPYKVNLNSSIIDIEKQFINSKIDIDLEPLIQSCPFKLKLLKKS
ncbi:MAG: polysaccharide pyruvyl transferase family protein [Campylobacterota bacterium]|nr:polysaccharide pyruvyl transferase family protein [Campylobacterota bacterium]